MKHQKRVPELTPQQAQRVWNKARAVVLAKPRPERFEVPLRKRGGRTVYVAFETKDYEIANGEFVTVPFPTVMTMTLFDVMTRD